jgi:hypothetical protein
MTCHRPQNRRVARRRHTCCRAFLQPMSDEGTVLKPNDRGHVGPVDEPVAAAGNLAGCRPPGGGPFGKLERCLGTGPLDPTEKDAAFRY